MDINVTQSLRVHPQSLESHSIQPFHQAPCNNQLQNSAAVKIRARDKAGPQTRAIVVGDGCVYVSGEWRVESREKREDRSSFMSQTPRCQTTKTNN